MSDDDIKQLPETLSAKQAAALLQVDKKTVYRYAERGQLPHRRLGRRFIFSRTALLTWLQSSNASAA
jgi:excisionase family DNA binding protein